MWWPNLTHFMPVLVLIMRVIHRSTLHSAVVQNIVHKSNTRVKTWKVASVEHIGQFEIKFVETSRYLKRRGRKAFLGQVQTPYHMSRIKCKWRRTKDFSHLHSIRLMLNTASEPGLRVLIFASHSLHHRVTVSCTLSPISFFLPIIF